MLIKLTKAEVNHLLYLLFDNEEDRSYYGNRNNWLKQHNSLVAKLTYKGEQYYE